MKEPKTKFINVSIPSSAKLKDIETTTPSNLNDDRVMKDYAYLKATRHFFIRGELPDEYFDGITDAGGVTGRVPKDVFLTSNLDSTIEDYSQEIKKRGIKNDYIITIERRNIVKEARI